MRLVGKIYLSDKKLVIKIWHFCGLQGLKIIPEVFFFDKIHLSTPSPLYLSIGQ